MACFSRNVDEIDRLNSIDSKATYGTNGFSDMCPEEFKLRYHNGNFGNVSGFPQVRPLSAQELAGFPADSFDWRQQGAVTGVKNQAQCGSCWTFSAVACMEGAWKLGGNPLVSLSEEELVQCAKSAGNGCQGGEMGAAIQWVIQNGGINSEDGYPYTSGNGVTGVCDTQKASVKVAHFSEMRRMPQDESQLVALLQQYGPLAIAVDATTGWQAYRGGIKTACSGRSLDHGVTIVGFGADYWIVKNSWATTWGEQGYIRLQRGVNCDGLAQQSCGAKV